MDRAHRSPRGRNHQIGSQRRLRLKNILIRYLIDRSRERSTQLAGLAFLAIAAWAAWQWRCDLWHVIAGGAAAAIAAIPEYAMRSAARYLSAIPSLTQESGFPKPTENGMSSITCAIEQHQPLGMYLVAMRAAELLAASNSSTAPPADKSQGPPVMTNSLEVLKEKIIADLGPGFRKDLENLVEAEIIACFRAAAPGGEVTDLVRFAARVIDAVKALTPAVAPAPEPAADTQITQS